jgi:hypothetical protein
MARTDLEPWPICFVRGCGDEINPRRAAIGYTTCFRHSNKDPMNVVPPLILQDVNKSNPTVTRQTDFINDVYADRVVRSELRSTRRFVRLDSVDKPESHLK